MKLAEEMEETRSNASGKSRSSRGRTHTSRKVEEKLRRPLGMAGVPSAPMPVEAPKGPLYRNWAVSDGTGRPPGLLVTSEPVIEQMVDHEGSLEEDLTNIMNDEGHSPEGAKLRQELCGAR